MKTFDPQQTIGEIVTEAPATARVFEVLGIDFCCGGGRTLAEACCRHGLDSEQVLFKLESADLTPVEGTSSVDVTSMSLTELADHIENTHHAYLLGELPRLARMATDVAAKHGDRDPRLHEVRKIFRSMALDLCSHMSKEEQCLFPMIRQLETSEGQVSFHCGTIANPIRQMELEHDDTGAALERLRKLTGGFAPPEWACRKYRALLAGLAQLERDMHLHVHKENNVLFRNALKVESARRRDVPVA